MIPAVLAETLLPFLYFLLLVIVSFLPGCAGPVLLKERILTLSRNRKNLHTGWNPSGFVQDRIALIRKNRILQRGAAVIFDGTMQAG